jgi:hypothetical protein
MTTTSAPIAIWKTTSSYLHSEMDDFDAANVDHSLDQDPRWLATFVQGDDKRLERLVLEQSGVLAGSATFFVHPSALRIAISDWSLYGRAVKRYTLFAQPLLNEIVVTDKSASLLALFEQISERLEADEVIFLQSVIDGSSLSEVLSKDSPLSRKYHILEYGERYRHRYIDFTGDYNHYLSQLSAGTRSDLKRTQKRFIAKVNGQYQTICYQNVNEISAFLDAAMAVSALTYQYKLLGAGLRDWTALEKRFTTTANLGWFRSYVLFVNQQPIAFQVGHLYRGCYHAQEIGYDPDWAKLQAGIFLHTEIVSDLLTVPNLVKRFDFGNDDNMHKQRLSNADRVEKYVYLIPRHWRNDLIVYAMRATNSMSTLVGRFLKRHGLRKRLRQLLWKLGVMK